MKYYCISCGWNANIEIWKTAIGKRYVCKNCGIKGLMSEYDAPKFLNENEQADNESNFDFEKRIFNL